MSITPPICRGFLCKTYGAPIHILLRRVAQSIHVFPSSLFLLDSSSPERVREVISGEADGVMVGSSMVQSRIYRKQSKGAPECGRIRKVAEGRYSRLDSKARYIFSVAIAVSSLEYKPAVALNLSSNPPLSLRDRSSSSVPSSFSKACRSSSDDGFFTSM